jgi:hypothetical protein
MDTDTTVADTNTVATTVVAKLTLEQVAKAVAAVLPGMANRPTKSSGYQCLDTVENTDENWRKGLLYILRQYVGGFTIEMMCYSTKKGAHLAEFKDRFNQFAGAKIGDELIVQRPCGLATVIKVKLPDGLGLEKMVENAKAFFDLVNAEVEAVRALVVLPAPAVKKAKKVKAEKTEAPAQGKKVAAKAKTKKPVAKVQEAAAPLNPEIEAALASI